MPMLRCAIAAFLLAAAAAAQRAPSAAEPATVGAHACATCHQRTHAAWRSGRHSKMLQPAGDASVVGDFSRRALTLNSRAYGLRAEGGAFFITESFLTGKPQEHRIEYTLGSRRIQHYLTTLENGWIVVLPPTWDVQRRGWFDNVEIVRPDEDARAIVQQWNRNCVGCHVSGQDNRYDPATRTYATRWTDFGTTCERCHGPGAAHAQQPAAPIVRPTRLEPARSSMICAQCHSLRDEIAPGYTAGADYYDHFQPALEYQPQKPSDPAYWADGRPRRFSNDAMGLWQSACFLRGGATCTTCHADAHVPDVDRSAQLAGANDRLCTRCHDAIAADVPRHTRHRPGSAGSRCVECHMPKTVVSIKATMRDHTIGVPAPANTVRFGIPNACGECHRDRSAQWAASAVARWWPQGRATKMARRAEAFTGGRVRRAGALEPLLAIAADAAEGPLVQANAIGYLAQYSDARAAAALLRAATADHPAIRSAAAWSLATQGAPGAARTTLLAALDDPRRAVRIAALLALITRGGGPLGDDGTARFRRVADEFALRARLHRDDARIQRELGLVYLTAGDVGPAAEALEISLELAADAPSVKFLLGLARLGQRRFNEARRLLLDVGPSDPFFGAAREALQELRRR